MTGHGTAHARGGRSTWPLWLLAAPAFVAVWSGWVGMGKLCGFGQVQPLPGIWDGLTIDTSITLPIGMEAYAAYAIRIWLSADAHPDAVQFARRSAKWALGVAAIGQVVYHLLTAAGVTAAPWPVTALVAVLPVAVLGMGAALAHLVQQPYTPPTEAERVVTEVDAPSMPIYQPARQSSPKSGLDRTSAAAGHSARPARPARKTGPKPAGTSASAEETAARVAELLAAEPELTNDEAAARLGVSARTVRRYKPANHQTDQTEDQPGAQLGNDTSATETESEMEGQAA